MMNTGICNFHDLIYIISSIINFTDLCTCFIFAVFLYTSVEPYAWKANLLFNGHPGQRCSIEEP